MGHIEGATRTQQILFPEVLDDYVAEDNPVRFIDAFIDNLDLNTLGFRHTQPCRHGPSFICS
jgi:transposase